MKSLAFENLIRRIKTEQIRLFDHFLTILFVPLVLFIRIIKPWRTIRFGYFFTERIGHWVFDLDYYLVSKQDTEITGLPLHDKFFLTSGKYSKPLICNEQLESMTQRSVDVQSFARHLYLANNLIPGGEIHSLHPARITNASRDIFGILQKYPTSLTFTDEEYDLGNTYLQNLGFTHSDRLVSLLVRDSAYLKRYNPRNKSWDYHDFRDSEIVNYSEAVNWLVERGYWVFRMGKVVKSKFPFQHPRVIDYATSETRTDFLDLWLVSRSLFSISNSTGLDSVCTAFRKPLLLIDFLPLCDLRHSEHSIGVPKRLRWKEGGGYFTIQEYLDHAYRTSEEYMRAGIEISNLTSSEIKQCVVEMVDRLNDNYISHDSEDRTQQRFWNQFIEHCNTHPAPIWIHPKARIGSVFSRLNPD